MNVVPARGGIKFSAMGRALGEKRVTISELFPEALDLQSKTGIPAVWQTEKPLVDLAADACEDLFARNPDSRDHVQALIVVTQSQDEFLPSVACRLHARLSLTPGVIAFDVNQGCSGFVQAIVIAAGLLQQFRSVLIVTADRYRNKIRDGDRSTQSIFSDAAAATLLTSDFGGYKIVAQSHLTDGSGAGLLRQSASTSDPYLYMNGREIYLFTRRVVGPQIRRLMGDEQDLTAPPKMFFLHQASKLVLDSLEDALTLEAAQVPRNIHEVGNTVSSSIPLLMMDTDLETVSAPLCLAGFGVGLSSSAVVLARKHGV